MRERVAERVTVRALSLCACAILLSCCVAEAGCLETQNAEHYLEHKDTRENGKLKIRIDAWKFPSDEAGRLSSEDGYVDMRSNVPHFNGRWVLPAGGGARFSGTTAKFDACPGVELSLSCEWQVVGYSSFWKCRVSEF